MAVMNPPFPKEISPSPLVSSAIEVRFVSDLKDNELVNFFYKKYSGNLPNLQGKPFPLPFELRDANPQFKYWTDYVLSNENYTFGFGKTSLVFEYLNEYPLWNNYFRFISDSLAAIFNSDKILKIERVGVRYTNLFQTETRFEDFLDSKVQLPLADYNVSN